MRKPTVPIKTVAFYGNRSDRTVRRMCENGELEAVIFGSEWDISVIGLKRKFRAMGKDFWRHVCFDYYRNSRKDAEEAYLEFLEIDAKAEAEERTRKATIGRK